MTDTHDPMTPVADAEDAARDARRDILVDILTALGVTRREAVQVQAEATASMRPLVLEAIRLGLMPTQLAGITGLSRRAIYDWVNADDGQPAGAGEQP